jgi:hypothetical protein
MSVCAPPVALQLPNLSVPLKLTVLATLSAASLQESHQRAWLEVHTGLEFKMLQTPS